MLHQIGSQLKRLLGLLWRTCTLLLYLLHELILGEELLDRLWVWRHLVHLHFFKGAEARVVTQDRTGEWRSRTSELLLNQAWSLIVVTHVSVQSYSAWVLSC